MIGGGGFRHNNYLEQLLLGVGERAHTHSHTKQTPLLLFRSLLVTALMGLNIPNMMVPLWLSLLSYFFVAVCVLVLSIAFSPLFRRRLQEMRLKMVKKNGFCKRLLAAGVPLWSKMS